MIREKSGKRGGGVDIYLMFLMPVMLTVMLIFAASIEREMQDSGEWQAEGSAFSEEAVRPLMLSDELPLEYTLKKLGRKKVITRI